MKTWIQFLIVAFIFFDPYYLFAQTPPDTLKPDSESLAKKAFKEGMGFITTNQSDTIVNESSVDVNKIYEGKIIRKIYLQHLGFEHSIYDSTKRTKKIVADVADALHETTRESIIRQHLFFKKNKPFNPYRVSDNERFIRDLDFILDCRIVVIPIPDQPDSIDISVITKDVFSLGMTLGGTIPTAPKIGIYDANLAGLGQRLEFTGLVDAANNPTFTSSAYYRKSSLFGSLANVELGYSQLNTGRRYGDETEYAYYLKASRPLVSPYSRLAGGLEFSQNWSHNIDQKPDSVFLSYRYNIADVWLGINLGIHQKFSNRNRLFLAGRYFDGSYLNQPDQAEYREEIKYNSVIGYLTELTFYRRDFYRTRYVFGFGRTEDVPYGISISATTGYLTEIGVERPYAGAKFNYSVANRKGNFFIFNFQSGAYLRSGKLEDGVVTTTVSYVTRVLNLGNYKMRGFAISGFASLLNANLLSPIEVTRTELFSFSADSVWGSKKAFLRIEPALYTPWQLLGFRFAPFLGGSVAWLDCSTCLERNQLFYEISGGIRTRNESLIFGTMELRFTYIPATDVTASKFAFGFKQRIKVKNSGSFAQAPSMIQH